MKNPALRIPLSIFHLPTVPADHELGKTFTGIA